MSECLKCQTYESEQMCLETMTEDCRLSRTSALIGLSESLWNECIIIVIVKCEEQYTYNILASPSLKGLLSPTTVRQQLNRHTLHKNTL